MKDAQEFGRLEDAMLYRVLPRVRRNDLKSEPVPPSDTRSSSTRSASARQAMRDEQRWTPVPTPVPTKAEPALPCFALSDSVPSIRISVRPPSPKFHVVCNQYEDLSDHVLEYASEPAIRLDDSDADVEVRPDRAEEERPSAAPLSLREGARPPRVGSTVFFLALIAMAVITMSIVALAVLVPGSDWALIQG